MTARSTILVTGGAGFVGRHFVRAATEAGSHLVVLDDLSGAPLPPSQNGSTFVRGDIGDRALVRQLLQDHMVTAVVHFAGKIQVGESVAMPAMYFDNNLTKTLALLDEVVAAGTGVFVFSSSAAVYGAPEESPIRETARLEPINPYGMTKLAVEYALAAYGAAHGLRWAALRYFNAAGAHPDGTLREVHDPESHLIPLAIDAALGRRAPLTVFGANYPTPDGTCVRDYVHVCDLADAHLLAIDALDAGCHVGATNLGAGTGSSVQQVLATCEQVLGRPVPHTIGDRRAGDPPILVADIARAGNILGWKPRRSTLASILEDAAGSRASEHP